MIFCIVIIVILSAYFFSIKDKLLQVSKKLYNTGETDALALNKSQQMMKILEAKLPLLEAEFMSVIYKLNILTGESSEELKRKFITKKDSTMHNVIDERNYTSIV